MTIGVDGSIGGQSLGRSDARTASDALEFVSLRPAWMRDALCREHPEVNFFPALGEPIEAAKAVCAGDAWLQDACAACTTSAGWGVACRCESGG